MWHAGLANISISNSDKSSYKLYRECSSNTMYSVQLTIWLRIFASIISFFKVCNLYSHAHTHAEWNRKKWGVFLNDNMFFCFAGIHAIQFLDFVLPCRVLTQLNWKWISTHIVSFFACPASDFVDVFFLPIRCHWFRFDENNNLNWKLFTIQWQQQPNKCERENTIEAFFSNSSIRINAFVDRKISIEWEGMSFFFFFALFFIMMIIPDMSCMAWLHNIMSK